MIGRAMPAPDTCLPSAFERALPDTFTDGELLEHFVRFGESTALEWLVRRQGPMVFGVCRRLLGNTPDAEDAFQATFLLLVRKAATLTQPERVGNWLYGVAYRVARKARARAAKRASLDKQVATMRPATVEDAPVVTDLRRVIDEELARLPEKYRAPIVLCYLEGKTNQEAAERLGWPLGTVAGRLSRARAMLHSRLMRRGLALSAVALGNFLTPDSLSAAVPPALFDATLHTALEVAGGAAVEEVALPRVAELLQTSVGLVVMEEAPRWVTTVAVLALLLLIGSCAAWTASPGSMRSPGFMRSPPAGSGPAAEGVGPDGAPLGGDECAAPVKSCGGCLAK
jgi:RNA polymerase sigma factor (sigma-70 family)